MRRTLQTTALARKQQAQDKKPTLEQVSFEYGRANEKILNVRSTLFRIDPNDEDAAFHEVQDAGSYVAQRLLAKHRVKLDVTALSTRHRTHIISAICKGTFALRNHHGTTDALPLPDLYVVMPRAPREVAYWTDQVWRQSAADFARRLASEPANIMYPQAFCDHVRATLEPWGTELVRIRVFDDKEMEAMGMNLVLAVGKSASQKPRFLVVEAHAEQAGRPRLCVLGKGVCFDSGGLNLKFGDYMTNMHTDKTGGAIAIATVLYALLACRGRPLPGRGGLVAIVPLVENMPDGNATRPGDVVTCISGQTVEIGDTDAEGRLILADAIAWACAEYNPHKLLDFATLTSPGFLCDSAFAYYTASTQMAAHVESAASDVGERCVAFPRYLSYARYTKSAVADFKSIDFQCSNGSSSGGSYMAAMFLSNFVPVHLRKHAWVHFDITHSHRGTAASYFTNANSIDTALELVNREFTKFAN